jgi:hypothetical protein
MSFSSDNGCDFIHRFVRKERRESFIKPRLLGWECPEYRGPSAVCPTPASAGRQIRAPLSNGGGTMTPVREHGGRLTAVLLLVLILVVLASVPTIVAAVTEEEPNDTYEEAQSIQPGTEVQGTIATGGDTDWFAVTVNEGETINVTGSVAPGDDPVTFRLYTAEGAKNGNGLTATTLGQESESLGTTVRDSGTYYVEMTGGSGADYSFTVETYETDDFEPNEDFENATQISANTTQSGQVTIGDTDWFQLEADAGETVNVTGSVEPGDDPVTFHLYTAEGAKNGDVLTGTTLGQESESLGTTVRDSGTYYVEMTGGSGADYSFTVETYETDDFEPNENRSMATQLFDNPFTPFTGQLSIGDTDFFAYPLAAGETLRAEVEAGPNVDAHQLRLYRPGVEEAANTTEIKGGETKVGTVTAQSAGVHHLGLWQGVVHDTGAYNFTITAAGETIGPPNDKFERQNPPVGNQDIQHATPISPGQYTDLGMVDDDVDVFEISLAQGEKLSTTIDFTHSENDLELVLWDSQGTTVAGQSDSNTDGESLNFTAPSDGDYYLAVSGEADAQAHYSMTVGIIQDVDVTIGPGGDALEPGDTATYAISVSNVGAGLSTANLTFTSNDTGVVTIQDVSPIGSATVEHKAVAAGSAKLNISGLDAGASGTVQIAEVTVSAIQNGTATLAGDASLSAAGGESYPVNSVQQTTIDIQGPPPTPTLPGFTNPATDVDGDGLYEDVNGDGEFTIADVQAFFEHRNSDVVQNNAALFNFDDNDPPDVTIRDVQALFQLFQEQG